MKFTVKEIKSHSGIEILPFPEWNSLRAAYPIHLKMVGREAETAVELKDPYLIDGS